MHYSEDYNRKKALILLEVFYISKIFLLLLFIFNFCKASTFYFPNALASSSSTGCMDPKV